MSQTTNLPAITQQKEPDVFISVGNIIVRPAETYEELTGLKLVDIGKLTIEEIKHLMAKFPEIMVLVIRDLYIANFSSKR